MAMTTRLLLFLGFCIALFGVILIFVGSMTGGSVASGGFILIGPFPIVFGSGNNGGLLAALAVTLGILMVVLTYVFSRRMAAPYST
jgi:uncharacterized membrane protein